MREVNLNIDEAKDFLKHIISNNRYLQENNKKPVAVEIIGDSGIGKTSMVLQVAEENKLNYVKLNLTQIEELGDLVGFPIRQFQLCKEASKSATNDLFSSNDEESECLWVDEHAIDEYVKRGFTFTGKKRQSHCPPEWIADVKGGGILILDDWNRAEMRFIQAVMELIDRQEYVSWKLPKDWHIILTANPDNGDYLVNSIDNAQRTRFVKVNLKFDIDIWARWAEKEKVDNRCINFLLLHPEYVNKDTNARSITNFFNSISSIEAFEENLNLIQMIGEGSVGPELTSLFTSFIHNKLDKIISPSEIFNHENFDYVKGRIRNIVGNKEKYRADLASIITTRIINYSIDFSEKNSISKDMLNKIAVICSEEELINSDLQYVIIKRLVGGNKIKFGKLLEKPELIKIATKL